MRALRSLALFGLVTLGVFALNGCVVGNARIAAEVDAVRWDLRPLELEPQAEIQLGRATLGFASSIARFVDDPDAALAADLIDEVDEIDLGIYELHGSRRDAPGDLGIDAREELADLGWKVLVRTREDDRESHWVFGRTIDRRTQLLLLSLERDELMVVRLEGDLGRILDQAIRRDDELMVATRTMRDEW